MQLHELKIRKTKRVQRVGRGGKRGSYSGRGIKGQKSRAGRRIRPALRDLVIRLPKLRGFKNKPLTRGLAILNLKDLARIKPRLQAVGFKVNPVTLKQIGLLPDDFRGKVKILGKGGINFPAMISGAGVSKGAAEKVKKAGGQVNE